MPSAVNSLHKNVVSQQNGFDVTYPIVSADWLKEHLGDPQVAIADCRFSLTDFNLGRHQYESGHIPGAIYFDLNQDLSSPIREHGGRHPLPNPEALSAKLAAAGITSQKTLVVAYDDSRFAFAARLWWLLRYLGHDQVAVLDGGFTHWQTAEYPVTSEIPSPTRGRFQSQIRADWVVGIEDVRRVVSRSLTAPTQELVETVLIDSREGDRYRGEREPIDPIAGHIPSALNYPWQDASNTQGYIRPPAEQRQRWEKVSDTKEIVVYCGSGVTACVNLLSLEIAGIQQTKLYTGSWSDWCSYL